MATSLPPLTWFRSFESAARQLSFTAAAQELGLTQSAISQQVRLLELKFGCVLFVRKSRGLALTDEGRRLLPMVSKAIATLRTATDNFEVSKNKDILTIATSVSIAQWYLVPYLRDFTNANDGAVVRLMTKVWPDEFLGGGVDLEIRFESMQSKGKDSIALGSNRIVLIGSKKLVGKVPIRGMPWENICRFPLIQVVGTTDTWQVWADSKQLSEQIRPAYLVDSHGMAIDLAKSGTGIALTSLTIAAPCLNDGSLVLLEPESTPAQDGYHLRINPEGNQLLSARFSNWLASKIADAEKSYR